MENIVLYSQEEILTELTKTLDQLLQNTNILYKEDLSVLNETEITSLRKMQESLTAHFIHTKQHLEEGQFSQSKKKEREKKLEAQIKKITEIDPYFLELFSQETQTIHVVGSRPRIGRNRKRSKSGKFTYSCF